MYLLSLLFVFLPLESFAVDGYYKNFFIAFNPPQYKQPSWISDDPVIGSVNTTIRLNHLFHINEKLAFQAAYNFSPRIQDPSLFTEQPILITLDPTDYRFKDFDAQLYPDDDDPAGSVGIFHNLDRALMTITTKSADIYIGRQAIAWGSARVINPTDIIAPFSFSELDKEERFGVDAVRIRFPLGIMGELDAGYIIGNKFRKRKSAFYIRGKFYVQKTDVSLICLRFRNHLLTGIDVARAIGGAGFWCEGAYVSAGAFDDKNYDSGENYFRGSIGMDYSFTSRTYGFVEYHYNEAGSNDPEEYWTNFSKAAYKDGSVYLMGRHYLAPGMTFQISPLITFSGLGLLNIGDQSMFLSPQIEYNIAENIYLSAGAFFAMGKQPERGLSTYTHEQNMPFILHSEYGSYYDIYFSSFRFYF